MGDEVINNTPERENDEFIKSSVDDLVPIPRESEVTPVCDDLECDMPVNTPLSTKRGCDDSKPRSYDVTFSNPLFEFNDDFILCNDNSIFDEEFEDISSLDPPKSAPLNYEPLGNSDSMSRSIETSDLILEELTAEIGLDDSIPTEIDDGYYDSEGDILFLEHLLIEETFSDPTPASGGKTRVMETPSFGFHHMPSPRPAAYSPKEVMYRYYHPHLTSGDGFDHEIKSKISYDLEDLRACFQSSNHAVSDHLHVIS
ncbi:hypothetical protein Tco_1580223 [Tanacetum coccineum]